MNIANLLAEEAKKARITCPYCCVYVLLNFNESQKIGFIEERKAKCPNCGQVIIQVRKVITTSTTNAFGKTELHNDYENWEIIYPIKRKICIDKRIPDEIRKDLNDANSIINISSDAAAGLVRRALERILKKYLGLGNRKLYKLIEKAEDVLHPRIFKLLNAAREFGNFGSHLKEDSHEEECLFVDYDEANAVLQAVKELAIDEFVNKNNDNKILEKLKNKKIRTKK